MTYIYVTEELRLKKYPASQNGFLKTCWGSVGWSTCSFFENIRIFSVFFQVVDFIPFRVCVVLQSVKKGNTCY